MRIITGSLKGRKIPVPESGEVRPTADRTKEAIFSVIAARRYFEGCRVLDLFAGTGNLGFEAISRGADHVHFVEQNATLVKAIESLAESFGVRSRITTVARPVDEFLRGSPEPFDLIFCDPPYELPGMERMVDTLLEKGWLREDGWFVLEHDKRHDFRSRPGCFHSRAYGRTTVTIFAPGETDP